MSTDKMILTNIISKIPIFQNNFPSTKSDIHPLDDEILSDLKQINSLLVDDDNEFELFKQVDTIKGLWKKLIEKSIISYVNIKRPTHKVGQVYTKIDIKPSGLTKERLAFMKTQMRLLYDDK